MNTCRHCRKPTDVGTYHTLCWRAHQKDRWNRARLAGDTGTMRAIERLMMPGPDLRACMRHRLRTATGADLEHVRRLAASAGLDLEDAPVT